VYIIPRHLLFGSSMSSVFDILVATCAALAIPCCTSGPWSWRFSRAAGITNCGLPLYLQTGATTEHFQDSRNTFPVNCSPASIALAALKMSSLRDYSMPWCQTRCNVSDRGRSHQPIFDLLLPTYRLAVRRRTVAALVAKRSEACPLRSLLTSSHFYSALMPSCPVFRSVARP
jgi:hypothetical protein